MLIPHKEIKSWNIFSIFLQHRTNVDDDGLLFPVLRLQSHRSNTHNYRNKGLKPRLSLRTRYDSIETSMNSMRPGRHDKALISG